jgi:glycosyltransferase involved in cell wall biosynthesis
MKLLQQEQSVTFDIVLLRGGPLEKEFEKLGDLIVLKPANYSSNKINLTYLINLIKSRIKIRQIFPKLRKADLVFSNTIVNGNILKKLKRFKKPVLTYVHELDSIPNFYPMETNLMESVKCSSIMLYPCMKVKEFLSGTFKVEEKKLMRLNYLLDLSLLKNKNSEKNTGFNSITICGVGTASSRKGTDLFIETAHEVIKKNNSIRFTWVGGFASKEDETRYRKSVKDFGIENNFEFTGLMNPSEVKTIYSKFDALFLSSREDPYPLVVLEAAFQKTPSIIFSESGGMVEFVSEENGWTVNGFDTVQSASIILSITKDSSRKKGISAYNRVVDWHLNPSLILDQFNAACKKVLS